MTAHKAPVNQWNHRPCAVVFVQTDEHASVADTGNLLYLNDVAVFQRLDIVRLNELVSRHRAVTRRCLAIRLKGHLAGRAFVLHAGELEVSTGGSAAISAKSGSSAVCAPSVSGMISERKFCVSIVELHVIRSSGIFRNPAISSTPVDLP